MSGAGPVATAALEEPELLHWMAVAAGRATIAGLYAAEQALADFGAARARSVTDAAAAPIAFTVRTPYGVLPAEHPQRAERVLERAVALVEAGDAHSAVNEVLRDVMDEADEAFYAELGALPAALARAPRFLGAALALAHFLDRALHDRPAKTADAPAWFEAAAALVRAQLAERAAGASPDSLGAPAAVLAAALGAAHPVAREAAALAAANTSPAERAQRAERERARQAALAEALLAQEWPDEADMKAARAADRDAKTPVPERCWALRNVAGALAMGGPGERARARELLEQAVLLKQRFAGAPDHPGALPELVALHGVLAAAPDWAADAAGVARLALRALAGVADAYAAIGDATSAVALLEAALRRYEEEAGVGSKAVQRVACEADALLAALPPEGRESVAAARRRGGGDALPDRVTAALTEELGAYQAGGGARSRVQEWDQRGAELIGDLL